jgi:hypothetical protein
MTRTPTTGGSTPDPRAQLRIRLAALTPDPPRTTELVEIAQLALDAKLPALALDCLARLDPLGQEARALRVAIGHRSESPRLPPPPPPGLASDPAEVVAQAFLHALGPATLLRRIEHLRWIPLLFLGAAFLLLGLPDGARTVAHGALFAAYLVWLVPAGLRIREQAWCDPGLGVPGAAEPARDTLRAGVIPHAGAVCGLALPALLGLFGGFGTGLILTPLSAAAATVVLVAAPILPHRLGFPFPAVPTLREVLAIGLAALLLTAGTAMTAVLAWAGGWAFLPALATAFITWVFLNRCAGVLARRMHLRLQAEDLRHRPLSLPAERPVLTPTAAQRVPEAPLPA